MIDSCAYYIFRGDILKDDKDIIDTMTRRLKFTAIISILIFFSVLQTMAGSASGIEASNLHWNPSNITEGGPSTIFVMVRNISLNESISVHLLVEDANLTMTQWEEDDMTNGDVIYSVEHEFTDPGIHNITVIVLTDTDSTSIIIGRISVDEDNDGKDDTILGMPRWWCSVSIIIATGAFIFITWAYFKGRKLQIQKEQETGVAGSQCSECGKNVSDDADRCPHCGADLSDVEYVCGKCGKLVSSSAEKCPHCGTILHNMGKGENAISRDRKGKKKFDPDLKKLDSPLNMKGKVECYECGCVYLRKETSCPECGSSRRKKSKRNS